MLIRSRACLYLYAFASSSHGFLASSSTARKQSVSALGPTNNRIKSFMSTSAEEVKSGGDDGPSSSSSPGLTDIGGNNGMKTSSSPSESITSWREKIAISIAKSRKIRGGNYVQLATVDPETLEPRCRTVVFRGFLPTSPSQDSSEAFVCKMITDLRSSKVSEVSENNGQCAEMVWWFSKSSEQYRIRGKLQFVGGGAFETDADAVLSKARKEQWGNLSDLAREQFYWKDPAVPYEPQASVPTGGRGDDGKVLPPPDNFLLMLLYPRYVDYLRLGDNYRQIDEMKNDDWVLSRVNP